MRTPGTSRSCRIHRTQPESHLRIGVVFASHRRARELMQELEQEELVRTHYNKVSGQWGTLYVPEVTFANYNFLIRKQHVLDLFTKQGGRYLDAGCGTGDFIPDLVQRGGDVYALDFAEEMIDR